MKLAKLRSGRIDDEEFSASEQVTPVPGSDIGVVYLVDPDGCTVSLARMPRRRGGHPRGPPS